MVFKKLHIRKAAVLNCANRTTDNHVVLFIYMYKRIYINDRVTPYNQNAVEIFEFSPTAFLLLTDR